MAVRPLAFGVRLRQPGRSVRVQADPRDPRRWLVEDERPRRATRRRSHPTLAGALRDLARAWRSRLH